MPGVPVWVEFCLRLPTGVLGRSLVFLEHRACRFLAQFVACGLMASAMPAAFARRSWREALGGRRRGALRMIPRTTRRRLHSPRWARKTTAVLWRLPQWLVGLAARPIGRLLLSLLLSIPLAGMLAARKWRGPLLGDREGLRRRPSSSPRRRWGVKQRIRRALHGLARAISWFERRVLRPVRQFVLCSLLVLALPGVAGRRRWRAALFGRRR